MRPEALPVLAEPGALRPEITVDTALFVIAALMIGSTVTMAKEPAQLPTGAAVPTGVAALLAGLFAQHGRAASIDAARRG